MRGWLDRLDAAKTGYAEAARRLDAAIAAARRTVAELAAAGYWPDPFALARERIAEAARRAIDRYNYLDQERALHLLNRAASGFRRAETLRYADPIAATEQYRRARRLALEARRSVRTSEPSDSGGWVPWGSGGEVGSTLSSTT
jgi:hypothetical protein